MRISATSVASERLDAAAGSVRRTRPHARVVAYGVAQRTREFGTRLALGGCAVGEVLGMVVRTARQGARGIGLAVGVVMAAVVARLWRRLCTGSIRSTP